MTDADLIDVLRDAAEALAIASIRGRTDTEIAELAGIAGRCMDAALALARRHQEATPAPYVMTARRTNAEPSGVPSRPCYVTERE